MVLAYSGGLKHLNYSLAERITGVVSRSASTWVEENWDRWRTRRSDQSQQTVYPGFERVYYRLTDASGGARYEERYLLGTSFARPLIAKALVELPSGKGPRLLPTGLPARAMTRCDLNLRLKRFAG